MKNPFLIASMMVTVLSMGCVAASQAQVSSDAGSIQPRTNASPSVPMSAPTATPPMTGQVQSINYDNKVLGIRFGRSVSRTLAIEPGFGEISLDKLHWRNKVNLTLVNPSATPLQFETVQRWGRQVVSVVPPHSQQMLTFSHSRPLKHDIKFFVMQQPSSAVASNEDYVTQQFQTVASAEQANMREALDGHTTMMQKALDQKTSELQRSQEESIREAMNQRAASYQYHPPTTQNEHHGSVRGYW